MKYLKHLGTAAFALVLMAGLASAQSTNGDFHPVPEPALMTLIAVGAGGVAWRAYKKKRK